MTNSPVDYLSDETDNDYFIPDSKVWICTNLAPQIESIGKVLAEGYSDRHLRRLDYLLKVCKGRTDLFYQVVDQFLAFRKVGSALMIKKKIPGTIKNTVRTYLDVLEGVGLCFRVPLGELTDRKDELTEMGKTAHIYFTPESKHLIEEVVVPFYLKIKEKIDLKKIKEEKIDVSYCKKCDLEYSIRDVGQRCMNCEDHYNRVSILQKKSY